MFSAAFDLSLASSLLAATAYTAFTLDFGLRLVRKALQPNRVSAVFLAALAGSALWAGLGLSAEVLLWPGRMDSWLLSVADQLRYALWFWFVLLLLRPDTPHRLVGDLRLFVALGATAIAGSALVLVARETGQDWATALGRPTALAELARAVVGLILVEQLLRNVSADTRWNAKPVCLGLGTIFVFDLFVYSQAALFSRFDGDALSVRAAVHSIAVPLLLLASRRQTDWLVKLHVSRAAVFHSATLLLVGSYLLLVAALGYYVRYTGGEWGRALQLVLIFVALIALAVLVLSGSMQSRLKVYISKNFFNYRYDYREEWLRFTAILSSSSSPQQMGDTVVRALANLVESPSGALWLRRASGDELIQVARWNMPALAERESINSAFATFLQDRAWIIDFDQWRRGDADYAGLAPPDWMALDARYWLAIPLMVGGELIGFVLLGRARASVEINWEVRDLLKTASSQASSYLAQMQAAEALLESKKFDAFNRMSAFVVHDLKNIVTQLSLMMKNAKRLRDNPEFQQDMLDTVENSLEKMRQLMLQLRDGDKPNGVTIGVDLTGIVKRLAVVATSKGRQLELQLLSPVSTRGHEERVERVIGHVIQNAFDASAVDSAVFLRLDEWGSQARVQIADHGSGMSQDFIQNRLFKPFQTTKPNGMGIGAYESYQYLLELGGEIKVESSPNNGTTVTILFPLFHAMTSSEMSLVGIL